MVTERIKIEKVNERKRNKPRFCAPSPFILAAPKEYNNQAGGKKKLNYAGCIPFNPLYKNGH